MDSTGRDWYYDKVYTNTQKAPLTDAQYNPQLVDRHHPLSHFFILCDKATEKALLDPCFFAYNVTLECMHDQTIFADGSVKKPKEGDPIVCELCHANKRIIYAVFDGMMDAADYLDTADVHKVAIYLASWDLVDKKGERFPTRAHKDARGNIDVRLNYMYNQDLKRGDKFGQALTDEEIEHGQKHVKTIPYNNENTVAIFEVPGVILDTNWSYNLVLRSLMMQRYKDVKVCRMKSEMTGFQRTPQYWREKFIEVDDLLKAPPQAERQAESLQS
jgi:hypothetical protein